MSQTDARRVAGDVGDPARTQTRHRPAHSRAGSGAWWVEDDEIGPIGDQPGTDRASRPRRPLGRSAAPFRTRHPEEVVDPTGYDEGIPVCREVALGVRAGLRVTLHGDDLAERGDRLGEEGREQPDPGIEVRARSPGCGSKPSTVSTKAVGANRWICQNPLAATVKS